MTVSAAKHRIQIRIFIFSSFLLLIRGNRAQTILRKIYTDTHEVCCKLDWVIQEETQIGIIVKQIQGEAVCFQLTAAGLKIGVGIGKYSVFSPVHQDMTDLMGADEAGLPLGKA